MHWCRSIEIFAVFDGEMDFYKIRGVVARVVYFCNSPLLQICMKNNAAITKFCKNNKKRLEFNASAGLSWRGDMHPVQQSGFLQSYPVRYYGIQDRLLTDHKVHG